MDLFSGDWQDANEIYDQMVELLLQKYGPVDKDFDENPTKRGDEWLDIHHIDETTLDDIGNRTTAAKKNDRNTLHIGFYTLEELKPMNRKERLVYANKIEHFLLHFLIECIRNSSDISGGPNFTWDGAVALKYFVLNRPHLIALQKRDDFYDDISLIDLTKVYKKLIDWKEWRLGTAATFWYTFLYNQPIDKKKLRDDILVILCDGDLNKLPAMIYGKIC
jgi:hypothetical protein